MVAVDLRGKARFSKLEEGDEAYSFEIVRKGTAFQKKDFLMSSYRFNKMTFFSYMQAILSSAQVFYCSDYEDERFEDGLTMNISNEKGEVIRQFSFTPQTGEKIIFESCTYFTERGEQIADPLTYKGLMFDELGNPFSPMYDEDYVVVALSYGNVLDERHVGKQYSMYDMEIFIAMQELTENALSLGIGLPSIEIEVRAKGKGKRPDEVRLKMSH